MKRQVIKIDERLCTGCGECIPGCPESVLRLVDGKARVVAESRCDAAGICIGRCPNGAITLEERTEPAAPVVEPAMAHGGGCPGSRPMAFEPPAQTAAHSSGGASALTQWPVQLHLLSPLTPLLRGSDLLLAADCAAFAMGDFHARLLQGRSLAIACPKLDDGLDSYEEKLVAMIDMAGVRSITVAVMEVPCCSGLVALARRAMERASAKVPLTVVVVSVKGEMLGEQSMPAGQPACSCGG